MNSSCISRGIRPSTRNVSTATLVGLLVLAASVAPAQFSTTAQRQLLPAENGSSTNLFVGFNPYARFSGSDSMGSGSALGRLLWAEKALGTVSAEEGYLAVGAWLFNRGDTNLYQVHVKRFFNQSFGAQIAVLGASEASGVDTTLLALYDLPISTSPDSPVRFGLQVGAGGYAYFSTGDGIQPTYFVQGSVFFKGGFAIDATYWYIKTPDGKFERVTAGVSYRF